MATLASTPMVSMIVAEVCRASASGRTGHLRGHHVVPLAIVVGRLDRLAVGLGRDEPGVDPVGPGGETFGGLGYSLGLQRVDQWLGQGDGAMSSPGLRRDQVLE